MLWIAQNVDLFENDVPLPPARIVAARAVAAGGPIVYVVRQRGRARHRTARCPPTRSCTGQPVWSTRCSSIRFASDRVEFSIRPKLARLGVHTLTVLRFVTPDGAVRPFEYSGDPGLVRLDPRWYQAAGRFVALGFFHILDGTDHLLFLFCLVIPFRRLRALVPVVTAFTVAHSITLIASAYNLAPDALWFPPLIETLIAMSIVYMALENIVAGAARTRDG